MKRHVVISSSVLVVFLSMLGNAAKADSTPSVPRLVLDALWVWGNPEMAEPGMHTLASFAQAAPAERAALLGVSNIVVAGLGLPRDDDKALALSADMAKTPRLVWEIGCDDEGGGPPFTYDETVARVARVMAKCPQVEGVLLDDMTSMMIPRGLKPEHLRSLKSLLRRECPKVMLWGVVYTMNLDFPNIDDYIRELDVINLWVWHAKDFPEVELRIKRLREEFPEKPIVLGLYLYDYGEGRPTPLSMLEQQRTTAFKLLNEGNIRDIVFLTINNDEKAVAQAKEWVSRVGSQTIGQLPENTNEIRISLAVPEEWHFSGEPWTQDADGNIRPPDKRNLHSRAFSLTNSFDDFEVEFEFNASYRETGTGTAGLILRGQDVNQFYLVHFPWGGQQLRAKHFWAVVSKVEGDGYLRNLGAAWVPNLPSETDRWYRVHVAAVGSEIRVWVDGREALCVHDGLYKNGFVGLAGYGWYSFRDIRIHGKASPPLPWTNPGQVPAHAFPIGLSSGQMPSACIASNGDVVVAAGNQLVRSKDKGRTWGQPETLPEKLGVVTDYGNGMFRASKERLSVMLYKDRKETLGPLPEIAMAESGDNGVTWSDPVPSTVAEGWPAIPASLVPYGPVTVNADGVLMRFLLGGAKDEAATFTDVRTWSATHCKAYVIRSADDGKSWTAPIEIDRPSWTDAARGTIPGSLDLTEPTGIVMGNTVTALVRPVYSPYMWQCWSYDGGATWDAASRTTFPGYAQSMARTVSGAIVCAHRYPLYSVNVSRDGGLNWDVGTIIDYPVWAMGALVEVEPDILLCLYMNAERSQPLLAQLIRVTQERVEPVSSR